MSVGRGVVVRVLVGLVGLAPLVPPTAAGAATAAKPQPDQRVVAGSVHGADRGTRLRGTVTVANRGGARAPASRLIVQLVHGSAYEVVGRERVPPLPAGTRRRVDVALALPAWLPTGRHTVRVCYGVRCRNVGRTTRTSVPVRPATYDADTPYVAGTRASRYWMDVPSGYDRTHRTPTELFVWLHGCGGRSAGDIYTVRPAPDRSYLAVAPLGREGGCWNVRTDEARVAAVVADVRRHFDVDPRRLVIGGYSSGGDLAYRFAFHHSTHVAGVLACNTSPFRDTGSSASASLRAARVRFRTVHLLHTGDTTYPAAGVRAEIRRMTDAGFRVQKVERPGHHYDAPDPDHGVPGTDADVARYLLPHLLDHWLSPGR